MEALGMFLACCLLMHPHTSFETKNSVPNGQIFMVVFHDKTVILLL